MFHITLWKYTPSWTHGRWKFKLYTRVKKRWGILPFSCPFYFEHNIHIKCEDLLNIYEILIIFQLYLSMSRKKFTKCINYWWKYVLYVFSLLNRGNIASGREGKIKNLMEQKFKCISSVGRPKYCNFSLKLLSASGDLDNCVEANQFFKPGYSWSNILSDRKLTWHRAHPKID